MRTLSSDEAYRQAGVDLQSAAAVVDIAKEAAADTRRMPWLLGGIGGFSSAFEIPPGYRQPVLLCACDGVGTKLKLAFECNRHDTIGVDLVAMSANDILVSGGKPLVFLDYVSTEKIQPEPLSQILRGIAEGCRQADCGLIGGETAEMPGFYAPGEYDLAGFCVGVAEKGHLYPKKEEIRAGDVLIGLSSSGLHSNGFSLVRKMLADQALDLQQVVPELGASLAETLLIPTRIYVAAVLALLKALPDAVHAMIHVTGGGFYDNIPRVLTPGLSAELDSSCWKAPPVFGYLQRLGNLSNETLWHTFNGGIGFILIVDSEAADAVLRFFNENTGETVQIIGKLVSTPNRSEVFIR